MSAVRVSTVLLFFAGLTISCSYERDPTEPPTANRQLSTAASYTISGEVLGPDGSTICGHVPEGASVRVRVLDPVNSPVIVASEWFDCPDQSSPLAYALSAPDGTYRLQAGMPRDPAIGELPYRYLEPGDVVVSGADIARDIQVLEGTPLAGSATLDGSPFAGVGLTFYYDVPQRIAAAVGASGSDGEWDETSPVRSPMWVQGSVPYRARSACSGYRLGTNRLAQPPTEGFIFPDEVSEIYCTLETSLATTFSHDRTRLVVTPMPGDIGGHASGELFAEYGPGWGVQFPVDESPERQVGTSDLFLGGLMVAIEPDIILSGFNVGGFLQCGAACRDFGMDGITDMAVTGSGKKVTWEYSDATSPEGVGLSVVQVSRDGKPPYDYVTFDYTFRNTGTSTITFYAGFWGDWDVDYHFGDDVGATERDGQLMYQTSEGGGTHVGTLLLSDHPISGNFFHNYPLLPEPISLSDQVAAMTGDLRRTEIGRADNRYFHAVGPITLKPRKKADLTIAIVAGDNKPQLLENAAAAASKKLKKPKEFGGWLSSTLLDFGDTLVVKPSESLPWDGDEFLTISGIESSWIFDSNLDSIALVVPRLDVEPTQMMIYLQGPEDITEFKDVEVTSTFTPSSDYASAPDISDGPFPMSFYIELSNEEPDHILTVAPDSDLPLTVTLDWMTDADLDIVWMDEDFNDYVNIDGATVSKPETSSLVVPAGETYRLWFNKWDTTAPPTLALVTITSP